MKRLLRSFSSAGSAGTGSAALRGIDVQLEGLEAARQALAFGEPSAELFQADALLIDDCQATAGTYDCVVGNPPYLRHEWIRDPMEKLARLDYREMIRRRLRTAMPSVELDGRCDLSVLFVLLGLTLLRPLGSLCFVLPAAILEAKYRRAVTSALLATDRSAVFLESSTSRSFPSAAVNTGIFVVGPGTTLDSAIGSIKRVRVQASLPELRLSSAFSSVKPCLDNSVPAGDTDLLVRLTEGKLAPLTSLAQVRYPIKTGLNRFFYPSRAVIEAFGIEEEFLLPVLKSPREVSSIALDPEQCSGRLFSCEYLEEELAHIGKAGALAYISWGAAQVTAQGVPWPRLPSLRDRTPWHAIPRWRTGDFLAPRFLDRRYLFVAPSRGVAADQTFYWLDLKEPRRKELAAAVLNSSFTHLALEIHGRSGLGDGVRQYALSDMAKLPILDFTRLDERFAAPILEAYRAVAARELLPAHEECREPDRILLDRCVAGALALSTRAPRQARDAVLQLLERRLARAGNARA